MQAEAAFRAQIRRVPGKKRTPPPSKGKKRTCKEVEGNGDLLAAGRESRSSHPLRYSIRETLPFCE